ncbi:hypothetical protein PQX77_000647 [Marasmius sp. AFHP31]|nr:hypothetical protein PQX77_000647 [Marasmius sp. AFHP31]
MHDWATEYGTAYKIEGCFGQPMLVISDPRAIRQVYHDAVQDYPEVREIRRITEMMFGKGVLWAIGEDHKRQRRVLSPAFSISHMREFWPLFQTHTTHLADKWDHELQGKDATIDVIPWLHKAALDIIGESAFNYQFHALDSKPNELTQTLHQLENQGLDNTPLTTLLVALPRHFTSFFASLQAKYFPTAMDQSCQRYRQLSNEKAQDMMKEAGLESEESVDSGKLERDVLSILVRANRQEDPKKRLSDAEIFAQMSTLIQAGHHTTGYTLAWTLFELSTHPEDQAKVYQEIKQAREKNRGEFASSDYDSLSYLTLVLKEVLRLHPVVPNLDREAMKNDVLLLDFPVTSIHGKTVSEVPVYRGQRIRVDMSTYNRLKSVWGADANEWNPARHQRMEPASEKNPTQVGLFANLLTFSGGPKGCIGWRFAFMEIQAIVVGLLERFEFSIVPGLDIEPVCPAAMTLVSPSVKGKEEEGAQLPLKITPRRVVE